MPIGSIRLEPPESLCQPRRRMVSAPRKRPHEHHAQDEIADAAFLALNIPRPVDELLHVVRRERSDDALTRERLEEALASAADRIELRSAAANGRDAVYARVGEQDVESDELPPVPPNSRIARILASVDQRCDELQAHYSSMEGRRRRRSSRKSSS